MTARTGYDLREGSQLIRERIRAAVGPCAGICPDRHADLIAAVVTRQAAPPAFQLSLDLQSRAAQLASRNGAGRLRVKGA